MASSGSLAGRCEYRARKQGTVLIVCTGTSGGHAACGLAACRSCDTSVAPTSTKRYAHSRPFCRPADEFTDRGMHQKPANSSEALSGAGRLFSPGTLRVSHTAAPPSPRHEPSPAGGRSAAAPAAQRGRVAPLRVVLQMNPAPSFWPATLWWPYRSVDARSVPRLTDRRPLSGPFEQQALPAAAMLRPPWPPDPPRRRRRVTPPCGSCRRPAGRTA